MIQPASHSDILSVSQPVNRSASKSGRQSVIQSINQSVSQSVSRSAGQSFRQPACQSVSGAVNFCSGGSSSAVPPFLAGPTPPGLDPVRGSVTPGACFYHKNQGESNTLLPPPPPGSDVPWSARRLAFIIKTQAGAALSWPLGLGTTTTTTTTTTTIRTPGSFPLFKTISLSFKQSVSQSDNQSVRQSISQQSSQPASQSASQSFR